MHKDALPTELRGQCPISDLNRGPLCNKAVVMLCRNLVMVSAGFEPAHPKIIELKSIALDHSAMTPLGLVVETYCSFSLKRNLKLLCMSLKSLLRGLNPRPSD